MANFIRLVIAQKIIQLGLRPGHVLLTATEHNINSLGGVRVVKHQAMILIRFRIGGL